MTRSHTFRYTLYGVLFGLAFPIMFTLGDMFLRQLPFTLGSVLQVQMSTPMHWAIDTAPFILGLLAGFAGMRQDTQDILAQHVQARDQAIERLQALQTNLEREVQDRTAQLQAAADIGRAAASVRNLDEVLRLALGLIQERLGFYHASIYLLDPSGRMAVLRESTGEVGAQLKARGHKLAVGSKSLIGWVTQNRTARVALDVEDDPLHFKNPLLPDTRSELAIPLIVGGRLLGALEVQSSEVHAFGAGDVQVLQTLAGQLSVAIENAELFEQTQERLTEMSALYQRVTGASWRNLLHGQPREKVYEAASGEAAADSGAPLRVPLRLRDQTLGTIELHGRPPDQWTPEERGALNTVAAQLVSALESAALLEETQRTRRREQLINQITEQVRASMNPVAILQSGARELGRALRATEVVVKLTSPAGNTDGAAAPMAYRYDGVQIAPLTESEYGQGQHAPPPGGLSIPIQLGREAQPLGVIELKRPGEGWSAEDVELTEAIADRMALALENAQLFQQTRARAQHLAALSEATLQLTGPQFDLERVLDLVARQALRLFEADGAGIWLPRGMDEIELKVNYLTAEDQSRSAPSAVRRSRRDEGIVGRVFDTARAVQLNSDPGQMGNEAPFSAALVVPMTWQGQVLGALALTHSKPGRVFGADDEQIAQLFAAQAAATLENARLFAETQQRIRELAAINNIGEALASHLEIRALLELVIDKLCQTFNVRNAYLALYDRRTNQIYIPYMLNDGQPDSVAPLPLGQGLTSLIVQSRQPLLINQDTERRIVELGAITTGKQAKSYLAVPVIAGDDVLGVISVQNTEQEGLFTEEDVRLLATIAASVGVALQNARLFEERQRHAQQLAAAAEIARAATSSLDLDELLRISVELIRERFGFYHASVFIVEPGSTMAVLRESTGEAGRQLKACRHQLAVGSRSLVGAATATRQPVVVQDVSHDPTHFKNPLLPDTRAEAVIPMLSGEQVVGAMDVQSSVPNAFGADAMDTLVTIADQLAVAVQNARLYDQTARLARREKLVMEISSKIRAAGDIDSMLRTAVTELRQALGVSHGAVRLGTAPRQPAPVPGDGPGPNGSDGSS